MEHLILVDGVMCAEIKRSPCETNPSYKTTIAATLDKKGCYIRPYSGNKSGQNITIAEYVALKRDRDTFAQYIVSSGLYKNVYFEADKFDEQYWEEYINILTAFVTKLGGGSELTIECKMERIENSSDKDTKKGSLFGIFKGNIRADVSKEEKRNIKKLKHLVVEDPKCSKKDIEQWIEQEKINVKALPMHLCNMIEKFLDKGCLKGKYLDVEQQCTITTDMIKKIKSFRFDMETSWLNKLFRRSPVLLFKDIDAHIQSLQKTFKQMEIVKEMIIEVHLKHDGIEN